MMVVRERENVCGVACMFVCAGEHVYLLDIQVCTYACSHVLALGGRGLLYGRGVATDTSVLDQHGCNCLSFHV